jgi:hypothetical protein
MIFLNHRLTFTLLKMSAPAESFLSPGATTFILLSDGFLDLQLGQGELLLQTLNFGCHTQQ